MRNDAGLTAYIMDRYQPLLPERVLGVGLKDMHGLSLQIQDQYLSQGLAIQWSLKQVF